jgi:hypothetical protein
MVPACMAELGSGGQLDGALPGGGGTVRRAADRSVEERSGLAPLRPHVELLC